MQKRLQTNMVQVAIYWQWFAKLKATMKKNHKCDGCKWLIIPDWVKNPAKAFKLAYCSHTQDKTWDWHQAELFCKGYEAKQEKRL